MSAANAQPEQDPEATTRLLPHAAARLPGLGADAAPREVPDFPPDCRAGDMVGEYRLVRKLSSGGYGTVFVAERVHPFVKQVALKVVRSDRTDEPRALARFDMERRLLARLDHPNIATLLDGGNSISGQMFLVMEYVHGDPITTYCDDRKLGLRSRLEIFLQLCDAVQHAHAKGVIHRDLSSRNVLVADGPGGDPVVKVIDFGLAKSRGDLGSPNKPMTDEEYLPGTPGYASPEQFEPGAARVDVRSDIYSLGAILYELLSGALPHDPKTLRSVGWSAIGTFLRQQPVKTPSERLSTMATSDAVAASRIAATRQERLDRLAGTLRAELEWIPLQALRPEQAERYQTVLSLSQDVRNYLDGNALKAAPESRIYRFRKFARRHQRSLAVTAVAFAALAATTIVVSLLLVERERALGAARERESELNAVLDFQARALSNPQAIGSAAQILREEVVRQVDRNLKAAAVPDAERVQSVASVDAALAGVNFPEVLRLSTREAVVMPAVAYVETGVGLRERVRALLLLNLGRSLLVLGFGPEARRPIAAAAGINEHLFGPDGEPTLRARQLLADTEPDKSVARAEALAVRAKLEELHGSGSPEAVEARRLQRDIDALLLDDAEGSLARAQEIADLSQVNAPGTRETLTDQLALGALQDVAGRRSEALATLERAMSSADAMNAPADLRAQALHALGAVLCRGSDPRDVERGLAMLRSASGLADTTHGLGHPVACWFRGDLAACLLLSRPRELASLDEVIRLIDLNIDIAKGLRLSPQSMRADQSNLATAFAAKSALIGDPSLLERAVREVREALRVARSAPGRPTLEVSQIQRAAGIMLARAGQLAEAETLLRDAVDQLSETGGLPGALERLRLGFELARVLRSVGRREEAIGVLQDAEAAARKEAVSDASESRWLVSTMLLGLLAEVAPEPARLSAQRSEVEKLRAAALASGQHACIDWHSIPGPPEPAPFIGH